MTVDGERYDVLVTSWAPVKVEWMNFDWGAEHVNLFAWFQEAYDATQAGQYVSRTVEFCGEETKVIDLMPRSINLGYLGQDDFLEVEFKESSIIG